ncbi:hypothetical protein [Nonomuraea sp. 10N515B]|uniref:hypothetical protein n=1 Tax=Nonomuraea sp. 10N515B TaxID=3457422 RepID=UPI003FCCB2A1
MRRFLSWRRSVGTLLAVVGMAPGLLVVQGQPVLAEAAAVVERDAAALPVIPQQMAGSAAGLSSLLPATQLSAVADASDGWRSEVQRPKGAVPREDRTPDAAEAEAAESKRLPAGVLRAEAADAALLAVPSLVDVYPKHGYLVDSLTPSLRAWGKSNNGNYAMSYSFNICDVETMSGTGCTTSGYVAGNKNTWSVPAGKLAWASSTGGRSPPATPTTPPPPPPRC